MRGLNAGEAENKVVYSMKSRYFEYSPNFVIILVFAILHILQVFGMERMEQYAKRYSLFNNTI